MGHETKLRPSIRMPADGRAGSAGHTPPSSWRCAKCGLCLARTGRGKVDVVYKDLRVMFHGKGLLVVRRNDARP